MDGWKPVGLKSRLSALSRSVEETGAWEPLLYEAADPGQVAALESLLDSGSVTRLHDDLQCQLEDLVSSRHPSLKLDGEELDEKVKGHLRGRDLEEYGTWVYYPWSGRLVHVLPEEEYRELRCDRNRYKITVGEQEKLREFVICIAGLSVGQATAVTLAMEGIGGQLRLADFDPLGLHNMNRIRTGVHDLGVNKAVIAARQIFEIDPYMDIVLLPEGVTTENIDRFLSGAHMLVEVCDDLSMKVLLRERAREMGLPVLMDTCDRGLFDMERFDREPDRPIFHGLVGNLPAEELRGLSTADKVPYALRIIGEDNISSRAAASLIEIEQTLSSWPQLASGVTLGAAVTADAARRVLLGEVTESGRFYVDLDEIVRDGASVPLPRARPMEVETSPEATRPASPGLPVQSGRTLDVDEVRLLVRHGILAPSGGNCQPWRFVFRGGQLYCHHDLERSRSFLDFESIGAHLALGAVVENISLAASAGGLGMTLDLFPDPDDPLLVCVLSFHRSGESHDVPDLVESVPMRVTNRKLGKRVPLGKEHAASLECSAGTVGARLQLLTAHDGLEEIASILGVGDRLRFLSKVMHAEMMAELRWTREEVESTRDGLDVVTLELSRADLAAMSVISSWSAMKALGMIGGGAALEKASKKLVAAASAVGLVTYEGTSPVSWFQGGRAMQRVWLRATALGLEFQPMAAITGLFARLEKGGEGLSQKEESILRGLRARYRSLFDLPPDTAEAMLFRLAVADPPSARSLRRRVEDVLVFE
jgi:nitroreductase